MQRLYQINRTLIQKLVDTGYEVSPAEIQASKSKETFEAVFTSKADLERVFYRTGKGLLFCFAELELDKKQIPTDEVRRLIRLLQDHQVEDAYFIADGPLSSNASKIIQTSNEIYRITVFEDRELLFNITHSARVPKHQVLTPEEAKTWLSETKVKKSQMPRIFDSDAMVKYYDCHVGDIVKVIRSSPTVGMFIHHVVVVRRLDKVRSK